MFVTVIGAILCRLVACKARSEDFACGHWEKSIRVVY